jgi:hypothetical protein
MKHSVPSIVRIDMKVSRASEARKGVGLTGEDLDLLMSIGLGDILAQAKADYLKEQARCRDTRLRSIDGGNTGSIGTSAPTGPGAPPISKSSGTTPPPDAQKALQRARRPRRKA